jgi:hypothetical protein
MIMDQIEKIKRLAVIAIVSDDYLMETLVLKGGNALDLIYQVSSRSSIDLDFSVENDFDQAQIDSIKNKLEQNLNRIFNGNGYDVFDISFSKTPNVATPIPKFWGGYLLEFKVISRQKVDSLALDLDKMRRNAEIIGPNQKKTFRVEISKFEYCRGKRQEDIDGYAVYVYTPEMMALEKLRAICQQTTDYIQAIGKSHQDGRARDFFDIHIICEHFGIDLTTPANIQLLKDIFAAKKVSLELLGKIREYREFHRMDFVVVEQTIKPKIKLKPYDFYFDFVIRLCDDLLHALRIE